MSHRGEGPDGGGKATLDAPSGDGFGLPSRRPGVQAPSSPPLPQTPPPLPTGPRAWLSPQDKLCGAFWRLVLAQRWMEQLKTVAGSQMEKLLEAVNTEIHFVTLCALQVSPELGVRVRGRDAFLGNGDRSSARPDGGFFGPEQLRAVEPVAGELHSSERPGWRGSWARAPPGFPSQAPLRGGAKGVSPLATRRRRGSKCPLD